MNNKRGQIKIKRSRPHADGLPGGVVRDRTTPGSQTTYPLTYDCCRCRG
jgi:hypothetical protein